MDRGLKEFQHRCSKCRVVKSSLEFGRSTSNKNGLQSWCDKCKSDLGVKIYWEDPEKFKSIAKKRNRVNPDRVRAINSKANKKLRKEHPEIVKARKEKWRTGDTPGAIRYRIGGNLRVRLRMAIAGNAKVGSAVRDLGCSIEELKLHLEARFYSNPDTGEKMSWDNYGREGWHIDHIRPLASFDLSDRAQLLQACNYMNLQPLWAKDNNKKADKW